MRRGENHSTVKLLCPLVGTRWDGFSSYRYRHEPTNHTGAPLIRCIAAGIEIVLFEVLCTQGSHHDASY